VHAPPCDELGRGQQQAGAGAGGQVERLEEAAPAQERVGVADERGVGGGEAARGAAGGGGVVVVLVSAAVVLVSAVSFLNKP